MIFGSLFSGIEAASVAWLPLGWRCAWTAEIDPFASAVLRHHYPNVPNLGDVERIDPHAVEPVDLVVFGSPCQPFSVAGKRLGLDDPRGNMALVGLRLIGKLRPRWVVWENVPGILSSDGGRDFGAFLGLLGQLGYGFAHTVLDAQHAGVPQRRRRVFVVGYLGDWRPPAAVLFEQQSLQRHSPPRREAGKRTPYPIAPSIGASGRGFERVGDPRGQDCLIAFGGNNTSGPIEVATACNAHGGPSGRLDFKTETPIAFSAKDHGADAGEVAPTLRAGGHTSSHANAGVMPAIAFQANASGDSHISDTAELCPTIREGRTGGSAIPAIAHALRADGFDASEDGTGRGTPPVAMPIKKAHGSSGNGAKRNSVNGADGDPMFTLDNASQHAVMFDPTARQPEWSIDRPMKTDGPPAVQSGMSVRRLTPGECLKLQGFPPDWLDIQYRGKPAADGNKYRSTGNSFAVPVIAWIGRRIQAVENSLAEQADAAN